jgi:NAD(P)H dehydrogenase (quinone)
MKASVILAHPYKLSFNHAIYNAVIDTLNSLEIFTYAHDLYRECFNPVLTEAELGKQPSHDPLVEEYTQELLESDVLIFIHPNWWGQPPAILKGYIDRVIRPPRAYDFPPDDSGGGLPIGKLHGKVGIVFNTSNTGEERETHYFNDPLEYIWKKCIFGFCGITESQRITFRIVADSTLEERAHWLLQVRDMVTDTVKTAATASS